MEPAVKTLYEAYAQDSVPMDEFAGVTMDDLYRVDKRTCACTVSYNRMQRMDRIERQLPNLSVDRYVSTLTHSTSIFTRHIFPSSRMYACTVTRIDVGSAVTRCGKTHGSYANTRARVREVCVESILVACTIRLHRYSNGWTTRTSEWPNRCGTIRTEPPSTLSVGSTPNNFRRTVTRFTGLHVTSR